MFQQGFTVGEAVPAFVAYSPGAAPFRIETTAGTWVMLLIPGALEPDAAEPLEAMVAPHAAALRPGRAVLVVLGAGPPHAGALRLAIGEGRILARDDDGSAHRALRAIRPDGALRTGWLLLDPARRVFGSWPLEEGAAAMATLAALPPPEAHAGLPLHPPVLIVPRVFEPAFCRRLIAVHRSRAEAAAAAEPGAPVRRRAVLVEEQELQVQIRGRITMRLLPELRRAFRFEATRMERYMIACYDARDGAFHGLHRDDDAPATAHRAFAATIALNEGDYEGGELCFPEFGMHGYRAPTGAALVFSGALLHEVRPVTKGRRFACLPFLFGEDGERIREANRRLAADGARAG